MGTRTYLSPEQETNRPYNEKVDIFALGLILCELCCKFSTNHERLSILNDLKYNNRLPENMTREYPIECQIMKILVNKDPESRPSAAEVLKHPLLDQWGKLYCHNTVVSPSDQEVNPSILKQIHLNLNSSSD